MNADNTNGPARILAVDDNPAALYATTRVLRSAGYEVVQATTGSAALAAAPDVDLVVLDINLPDIDGFEVCRRLRASPDTAQLPVLHLSATFTPRWHRGQMAFNRHRHRGQKPNPGSTSAPHCEQFKVRGFRRTKYKTMPSP